MTTERVDAHHHFLDPGRVDYPWLTPELEPIRRRFGFADLAPLLAAAGIDRTILVQARSTLDESRDCLAATVEARFIAGVVGWVDLTDPGVEDTIAALRAGPGGDALVGIRHPVQDEPDPDWLRRADVRRGLRAVATAGLTYDVLVRPRELPAALDMVRALPDLRFVVDHLAKPAIRSGQLAPWAGLMAAVADCPNAWCKLSGLVTEADWTSWTLADLSPYVDHALDSFGPERLLFGSDWPVCLLAAPYAGVVDAALQLTAGLSDPERAAIFGENARAAYALRDDAD
jgi:L-fucono-1,5-lactonase